MDHNPFISRNNDLFIMLTAGASVFFLTTYLFPLSVQMQFVIILSLGFLAGLFMNYLYQSLEWALFFALGVQLIALSPLLIASLYQGDFILIELVRTGIEAGKYSLFLLSSWVIAIPSGYLLQKLIMGNYYRRRLF